MITTSPGTLLYDYCRRIDAMKPGEAFCVDMYELRNIASYEHNGAWFYPPDRILGNIVGSGYTHSYEVQRGQVTFYRHKETGRRYYEEPDRR